MVCSRGGALLGECLDALGEQGVPHQACVILDGASATEAKAWSERYPEAWVVARPQRSGFGPCVQVGLERARSLGAEWVLLLNDDVRMEPQALERMLAAGQADPRVAAVAPVLLDAQGTIVSVHEGAPPDDAALGRWLSPAAATPAR